MTLRKTLLSAIAATMTLANTAIAADAPIDSAHSAHIRYLAAINANDADAVLTAVTDDIVLIAPNAPAMVGKSNVAPWVLGYFDTVETSWKKSTVEFVTSGDWAFERYTYLATDRPRDGSQPTVDTGNGINIYRLGSDKVWRVARDVWATNRATSHAEDGFEMADCTGTNGPC